MSFTFRPLPLLGNPHLQTLLGNLLHGRARPPAAERHVVELPDGDRLVLHDSVPGGLAAGRPGRRAGPRPGRLPPLGYMERVAARLLADGLRRGADGPARLRRGARPWPAALQRRLL